MKGRLKRVPYHSGTPYTFGPCNDPLEPTDECFAGIKYGRCGVYRSPDGTVNESIRMIVRVRNLYRVLLLRGMPRDLTDFFARRVYFFLLWHPPTTVILLTPDDSAMALDLWKRKIAIYKSHHIWKQLSEHPIAAVAESVPSERELAELNANVLETKIRLRCAILAKDIDAFVAKRNGLLPLK